jgi:hypothetical protein
LKPGDWIVLYAALAGIVVIVVCVTIYFIANPP